MSLIIPIIAPDGSSGTITLSDLKEVDVMNRRTFLVTTTAVVVAGGWTHGGGGGGSSGWTNWVPTLTGGNTSVTQQEGTGYSGAGTRAVYVSSSSGNDANPGTLASPKQTLIGASGGVASIRAGFPDWLLLKKGDTFNVGTTSIPGKAGPNSTTPIIVGPYDPTQPGVVDPITSGGVRPLVTGDNDPVFNPAWDFAAFVGLHIKSITAAAGTPFHWTGTATYPGSAPTVDYPSNVLKGNWTWFENVLIDNFDRVVFEAGYGTFTFKRCVFIDIGTLGLFCDRTNSVNLIDCVFDNDSSDGQSASVRNVYIEQSCVRSTVTGLITTRSGSTGMQSRPNNTLVDNCLSLQNTMGFQIGATTGNSPPGFVTNNMLIQNCVVMEGTDIPGTPQKIGIALYQQQSAVSGSGSTCKALNNIMCFQNGSAPFFSACAFDISQSVNAYVANSIAFNWKPEVIPPPIIGNSGSLGGSPLVSDQSTNTVYATNNWDYLGTNNNPSGNAPAEPFPDPNRNMASYMTSIGKSPATTAGYITAIRLQSKDTWNPALMAQAVNTYIRAGFGR